MKYTVQICPECGAQWVSDLGPGCHALDPITVPAIAVTNERVLWNRLVDGGVAGLDATKAVAALLATEGADDAEDH